MRRVLWILVAVAFLATPVAAQRGKPPSGAPPPGAKPPAECLPPGFTPPTGSTPPAGTPPKKPGRRGGGL